MRQLTTLQICIMNVGGALMLLSIIGRLFFPFFSPYAYSLIFLTGAMGFGCMQMLQQYEGDNLTLLRLRKIQVSADILFIFTGFFMLLPFMGVYHIPFLNMTTWRNEWLMPLMVGAVLELYSTFRIAHELEKGA